MVCYNLFLYITIREKSYLLYIGYILSYLGFQMGISGYGFKYLWPDSPNWEKMNVLFFVPLIVVTSNPFVINFLALRSNLSIHAERILYLFQIVAAVFCFMPFFVTHYSWGIYMSLFPSFNCLLIWIFAVLVWYRGYRPAKFFTIAWTFFLWGSHPVVDDCSFMVVGWNPQK